MSSTLTKLIKKGRGAGNVAIVTIHILKFATKFVEGDLFFVFQFLLPLNVKSMQ